MNKKTLKTIASTLLIAGVLTLLAAIYSDFTEKKQADYSHPSTNEQSSPPLTKDRQSTQVQLNGDPANQLPTISIEVTEDSTAKSISQELADKGLIEDAEEYQEFLEANNYHTSLIPARYELHDFMSYKEIAEKITSPADEN